MVINKKLTIRLSTLVIVLFGCVFLYVPRVNAAALQCCLVSIYQTDSLSQGKAQSCRIKNYLQACNSTSICVTKDSSWFHKTFVSGTDCLEMQSEAQVDCTSNAEFCGPEMAKNANCSGLATSGDCAVSSDTCFWSDSKNRCIGKYDDTVCNALNPRDCGKSLTCSVTTDGCISKLQGTLQDIYGGGKTGIFTTACAVRGDCKDVNDILELVIKIGKQLFGFVGIISFAFFVYGGFTMILSFGNSEKFQHGKDILVAAVIGIVITFSAYLIIQFILNALGVVSGFRVI